MVLQFYPHEQIQVLERENGQMMILESDQLGNKPDLMKKLNDYKTSLCKA